MPIFIYFSYFEHLRKYLFSFSLFAPQQAEYKPVMRQQPKTFASLCVCVVCGRVGVWKHGHPKTKCQNNGSEAPHHTTTNMADMMGKPTFHKATIRKHATFSHINNYRRGCDEVLKTITIFTRHRFVRYRHL